MSPPHAPTLLQRTPARALWAVAWPVAVMGYLRTGTLLTDSWFVGRLGDDALAAIGGTAFGWWMIQLWAEIPAFGVHAVVARHTGAGRHDRVGPTIVQGLWVGLACAVGLLGCLPLVATYLDALGFVDGSAARDPGRAWLVASLLGGLPLAAHAVIGAGFRGLGDTRAALVITTGSFSLNALLDPLLIGAFGIAGAAWATTAANTLGAAFGAWWLAQRGHRLTFVVPDRAEIAELVRIGGPVSARGIGFSLVYVGLGRMLTTFGEAPLGGLGLGHRLESLAYQVCVAFEVAAATMVGQHLGAGDRPGARRAADTAAGVAGAAMVPIGALVFVGAPWVLAAFGAGPETLDAGARYLRWQTLTFVFMAFESVYSGAYAGSGRTSFPFWVVTAGTVLRLPIGWLLAFPLGLGADGIWIAISVTTALRGIGTAWGFRRGVAVG